MRANIQNFTFALHVHCVPKKRPNLWSSISTLNINRFSIFFTDAFCVHLKCAGVLNNYVVANCPQNMAVKNSEKSVKFGENMENDKVGRSFWDTV